jgi:class 3 adenylate cyclase/tetratricopeptide (TPR) repeat protein
VDAALNNGFARGNQSHSICPVGNDTCVAGELDPYLCDLHRSWLADDSQRNWREDDGSLLFFDISGFTPLTERLARRGKAGVEQLIETLNGVVAPLVETAAALGGDTLKFGGDALLLLFTGPGHAARACAAAWDMQGAMSPYRNMRTSAGVVSLRASAGVASGRVHTFLVGDRFHELVLAGPVTSAVMGLERDARAGEVLVGPETAAALDPSQLGRSPTGGLTLGARPDHVAVLVGSPVRPADSGRGLPAALHAHLGPDAESEHRQVTVAFAQFRGLDEILRDAGPAAAAAQLEALLGRAQDACERFGVTFLATDADNGAGKLFLVAGAPTASTDDEDRMLHALREIVADGGDLRLRAGANRGRAFAVHLGAPQRRTYTTMGDTTNLAARVMGKAPDGAVLATRAVLERVRAPFVRTPVEPFAVKGKSALIDAEIIGPLGAVTDRADRGGTALAGREAELETLRAALARARAGEGGLVLLVGEPGIGKSRLMAEISADAEQLGMRRIVVEGGAYGTSTPYFAMRAPLRRLIGAEHDDEVAAKLAARVREHLPQAEPLLPLLGVAFGLELPATVESARLSSDASAAQLHFLVDRLLAALLPARETLVLIEDAHWLDEASSELLRTVLRRVGERGWAAIVTRRPGDDGLTDLQVAQTRIELEPLGADAARSLVAARGEGALAPHLTTALVERANGNPLFLRELAAAARAGARLDELPDTVEALLTARIDTLAPAQRRLLRRAAVLGMRFPLAWLAGMLEQPEAELRDSLVPLGDFIELEPGAERVRFGHALQREAAYETLPYTRRRALHARAGELIERELGEAAPSAADILGLHFLRAHEYERAWRYGRLAADQARDRFAPADAAELYVRAIEAARALPSLPSAELADVWQALGEARSRTGEPAAAMEAFTRARRLVGDDGLRHAQLKLCHARVALDARNLTRTVRWLVRALRSLDGDAPDVAACRAEVTAELASVRNWQGRMPEAIALCRDAVEIAERHSARSALAQALYTWDAARVLLDRNCDPLHSWRALDIYRELGNLDREGAVLMNLGATAYFQGRWADAIELYRQAGAASARAGDLANAAIGDLNIGEVLVDQGLLSEAEACLQHALEVFRGSGYEWSVAFANALLGRSAMRSGHHEEGFERLAEAFAGFRQLRMGQDVVWVEALIAEARVYAGDSEAALAAAERLLGDLDGGGHLASLLHRVRGCALAQLGLSDAAADALRASTDEARARDAPFELALTLDALLALNGQRGDDVPAEDVSRRERDEIVARLHVVSLPPVPIVADAIAPAVAPTV